MILDNNFDKFDKLYEDLYKKHGRILEKMRKKLKIIIASGVVLLIIWGIVSLLIRNAILSIFIGIIALIAFYLYYDKHESKYIEFYKKEIISKFFKLLNENLIYVRNRNEITELMGEYKFSKLNKIFDAFEAKDFIEGYVDNDIFVKMCGLHVRIGAGKQIHKLRINSVFSFVVLNKYVKSQIKITTKHKCEKNSIKIASEEFEKNFHIYSLNEEYAKKIINENLTNHLNKFYIQNNLNFEIILKSNRVYLRFFRDGMFEPRIFGNSMNKAALLRDFNMLDFAVTLTKKINDELLKVE